MSSTPAPAPGGSTPTAATPGEGLSQSARLVDTFIAPSKTFMDINRNTSWWVPWLLMSVISLAFVMVAGQKVGFEKITNTQMQSNPKQVERMEKLPPDQRAQNLALAVKITQGISYATPLFILLFAVIIAAVLMGTFNFGAGTQMKFGAAMAVTIYAFVPGILKTLLATVSLLAGADPDAFRIDNPIATNPGFFLSSTEHPALYKLASSIDVFTIWTMILMVIGFTCISKAKKGTSVAIVFGWYIVVTLIGVGFAAM
jgi:Yip1 domain